METIEIKKSLVNTFIERFPSEAAGILKNAPNREILDYLQQQPLEIAKEILLKLGRDISSTVLMDMDDLFFVKLFSYLDSYTSARLLSTLGKAEIERKLGLLPIKHSKEIIELITYPSNSAGFLMDTRFITFYPENTVKDVLKKLRQIKDRKIFNIYIIDKNEHLLGKIPIQAIAISPPKEILNNLIEESKSIHVMSPQDEVVELLKGGKLINLPVVDFDNKLLGIIRYDALIEAAQKDATGNVQAMFGAGREERALSKVSFAVKKRLPWLEINLATAFLAAAVVGIFEDTIAQITILAVFLPVVAGQSGNTGSQALAVTIRGLALREIRTAQWFRIAKKEAAVGLINGVAVSLTTAVIVYFWASSFGLALIIAVSMIFSMIIAGFSGAAIPIFLKSIGQDPAQSSSIVLTTVTDIVGFLSFLGLATALGSMLGVI